MYDPYHQLGPSGLCGDYVNCGFGVLRFVLKKDCPDIHTGIIAEFSGGTKFHFPFPTYTQYALSQGRWAEGDFAAPLDIPAVQQMDKLITDLNHAIQSRAEVAEIRKLWEEIRALLYGKKSKPGS